MYRCLGDIRFALRLVRRHRAFTLTVVATMALGIGVATSIFSVAHAALWRPLPYAAPERLVVVRMSVHGRPAAAALAGAEVTDLRDAAHIFSSVGALAVVNGDLTSRHGDQPMERVAAASATGSLFDTLGVRMALGRALDERIDTGPGPVRAVVISHELWTRRYGADPALLGRTIEVNNLPLTLVGVLPEGFRMMAPDDAAVPSRIDVWFPAALERDRGSRAYVVIGRLAEGLSLPAARSALASLALRMRAAHPDAYAAVPIALTAEDLQQDAVRSVKPALLALFGAVLFVLLIACANVSHLLFARTAARRREFAVRTAIGAGRSRVVLQLLTETAVLALAGGALGLLAAQWTASLVEWIRPSTLPSAAIRTDASVLGFACAITLFVSVAATLASAAPGIKADVADVLRRGLGGGPSRTRLRTALVFIEVTLSVVLLTGAGLMIRTVAALNRVDPGFDDRGVLTLRASMRPREFDTLDKKWRFYSEALQQVAAIPGVQAVSAVRPLPLEGRTFTERVEIQETTEVLTAASHSTLPGYFSVMGIRLLQGRDFEVRDIALKHPAVVVDDRFARAAWPGSDPLGRRVLVHRNGTASSFEVVGVVGHVQASGLRDRGAPQLYLPYHALPIFDMAIVIKSAADPGSLAAVARDRIEAVGGRRPVYDVQPMSSYVAAATGESRFVLVLLGSFAALALLLAVVGLYSVVADTTRERSHEIALRIALGAARSDIVRLVIGGGLRWTLAGIGLGTALAIASAVSIRALLFGVSPADPLTSVGVAGLLIAVTLLACYAPARRAVRLSAAESMKAQ